MKNLGPCLVFLLGGVLLLADGGGIDFRFPDWLPIPSIIVDPSVGQMEKDAELWARKLNRPTEIDKVATLFQRVATNPPATATEVFEQLRAGLQGDLGAMSALEWSDFRTAFSIRMSELAAAGKVDQTGKSAVPYLSAVVAGLNSAKK